MTPSSFARAEPSSSPSGVPAITTWPGALSFATQHAVRRGLARALGLVERRPEQRGHAARMRVGRRLRELGAARREPDAFVERETACCDQRGDLPERVAGERNGRFGERLHRLPGDQRVEQYRELRVARARSTSAGASVMR